jgi:hypothetical protein
MKISAIKTSLKESEPNGIYSADKMDFSRKRKNRTKIIKTVATSF